MMCAISTHSLTAFSGGPTVPDNTGSPTLNQ
jgi:hypothetical protein